MYVTKKPRSVCKSKYINIICLIEQYGTLNLNNINECVVDDLKSRLSPEPELLRGCKFDRYDALMGLVK